jgi:uncharacterized membrane protein HdeD (DUF308 family)
MSETATTGGESMDRTTGLAGSAGTMQIVGVALVIIGVLAVVFPLFTGLSVSILLGAALVAAAFFQVAHAFSAQRWRGFLWETLLAVFYVIAGILLLANPVLGLITLTILLAANFLVTGLVEVVMGLRVREGKGWYWPVISGVVSVVVGVLLWLGLPSTAVWAVGLLFGVGLVSTGLSTFALGRSARQKRRTGATGAGVGGV